MSREVTADVARFRRLKAVAIVLAVLLVAPGTNVIASFVGASVAKKGGASGIDSAWILAAPDAFAAIERVEETVEPGDSEVPDAFAQEVGVLPQARDVRVSAEGSVVGYVVDDDAQSVLDELSGELESRGWTSVPLAGETGATFLKQSGSCTWAMATCTQTGASTSVVVRWRA